MRRAFILLVMVLLIAASAYGASDALYRFCVNKPPQIYNITFGQNGGTPSGPTAFIYFKEGDSAIADFYAKDDDGDLISFVNGSVYNSNGSNPHPIDMFVATVLPAYSVVRFETDPAYSIDYFDDRNTFDAMVRVIAFDNSSCVNNNHTVEVNIGMIPYDNPVEFITNTPAIRVNISENETLNFSVLMYEPDNNVSNFINYPDVSNPHLNNSIDDDPFYAQWSVDYVMKAKSGFSVNHSLVWVNFSYTPNFSESGNRIIVLIANSTPVYYITEMGWNVTVLNVNRPPVFTSIIPNYNWYERNTLRALEIYEHVYDPDVAINDGDYLTFSVIYHGSRNITVGINPNVPNTVTFSQPEDFTGSQVVQFNVTDSHGAWNVSNNITLTVRELVTATSVPQEDTGSLDEDPSTGRPDSGGNDDDSDCEEEWYCTPWVCKPTNSMYRTCYDLNYCGTFEFNPPATGSCEYSPECENGVWDQEEDNLDCGGPCPPCYTCFDRERNQGETGIDCGGPCRACANCSDGIKNQDETEIDCGGSCGSCGNCTDGIKNQDETGIDCGGICPLCTEPDEEMGINLKIGQYPLQFLAILSLVTTFFMAGIVAAYHYRRGLIHEIGALFEKKKEIKPVVKQAPKAADPAKEALEKLSHLNHPHYSNKDIDKLTNLIRQYMIDVFGLTTGFTVEELKDELKRRAVDPMLSSILVSFFNKLGDVAYSGREMHGKEFQSIVAEARELVSITSPRKHSVKIQKRPKKVSIRVIGENPEEIFRLVTESYASLSKGDSIVAAEIYHKALDVYEKLPEEKKADIYDTLERLHHEIDLFENRFG